MFSKYTNKESIKKLLTRTKDVIEVIKDESTKTISSIKDKIDEKSKNWEPLDKDDASENNKDNVSDK